jgi:hypothetical protein
MHRPRRVALGLVGGPTLALAAVQSASAHGGDAPAPTLTTILTSWAGDPLPWLGVVGATLAYLVLVRFVNRAHP